MPESQVDAFLSFDCEDQDIKKALQGESIDAQALNWFHVTNFSVSLGGASLGGAQARNTPAAPGGKQDDTGARSHGASQYYRVGTQPRNSEDHAFPPFDVEMPMQVGSPVLMKLCTEYARAQTEEDKKKLEIKGVELWVRRAGMAQYAAAGSEQDYFLRICLGKVTIASYRTTIDCQDSISMNYESMTVEYWRADPDTGE